MCRFIIKMATQSSMNLRTLIEKENRFNGTNFSDWYRNLRIVLKSERKLHVIDQPVPAVPAEEATQAERDAYAKYLEDADDVQCLLLAAMTSDLQKQHEQQDARSIIQNLKELFQKRARHERYEEESGIG